MGKVTPQLLREYKIFSNSDAYNLLDRAADTIEELEKKCLNPLERNELEKAMLGRGVDYETIQLIMNDFHARIEHLHSIYQK